MREINLNDFNENVFKIGKEAALVTAGKINNYNTMTIGWATFGFIWGKCVLTCYVRPSRYTYKFMEENEYFTVSFYDTKYKKQLGYLGTKSGRDLNKVKEVDFHPIVLDYNTTSFNEARITFICKKIYYQDLDEGRIIEDVKKRYYNTDDYHRTYYGEIIKCIEN